MTIKSQLIIYRGDPYLSKPKVCLAHGLGIHKIDIGKNYGNSIQDFMRQHELVIRSKSRRLVAVLSCQPTSFQNDKKFFNFVSKTQRLKQFNLNLSNFIFPSKDIDKRVQRLYMRGGKRITNVKL